VLVEPSCGRGGPGVIGLSPDPQDDAPPPALPSAAAGESDDPLDDSPAVYRDIWNLRASLEQYAASEQSSNNDRNSVCSDADSVCSLGGRAAETETERGELPSYPSQDLGDEAEVEVEARVDEKEKLTRSKDGELGPEEAKTKKKRGTAVDSERREGGGGGGDGENGGNRKLVQMDSGYASIEAPCRGPEDLRLFGPGGSSGGSSNNGGGGGGSPKDRTALERRHHFTSAGRTGTVGESFESYLFEEEPEEGEEPAVVAGASGGVAIAKGAGAMLGWSPYGQMFTPREVAQSTPTPPPQPQPPPQPLILHRRDYSIDEKTDALFHEFLRHDPQFDQHQESPAKKHRSRVHLRQQWQRHKQWSDPGVRHFHSSFERQRTPLRRGDSVSYLSDASFHVTLPRIVSGPDEEASDGSTTGSAPETPKLLLDAAAAAKTKTKRKALDEGRERGGAEAGSRKPGSAAGGDDQETQPALPLPPSVSEKDGRPEENPEPHEDGGLSLSLRDSTSHGPQTITAELTDKLAAGLDERLYTGLRQARDTTAVVAPTGALECVAVTVARASPDHSPV